MKRPMLMGVTQFEIQSQLLKLYKEISSISIDLTSLTSIVSALSGTVSALSGTVSALSGTVSDLSDEVDTIISNNSKTLNATLKSTNLDTYQLFGSSSFNPEEFQTTDQLEFAVLVKSDNGQTFEIRLYDLTAGAAVAGSNVTTTSNSFVELTANINLVSADHIYEVQGKLNTGFGGSDFGYVTSAEIRVA